MPNNLRMNKAFPVLPVVHFNPYNPGISVQVSAAQQPVIVFNYFTADGLKRSIVILDVSMVANTSFF
jgi:hypothetical protein